MSRSKLSFDTTRIIRHLVATIAFRASRSLRDAPDGFESVQLSQGAMTARELVLHITNVLSFALATVKGTNRVRHEPLDWQQEIDRFYSLLAELDTELNQGAVLEEGMELKLVQGPLADTLTHIGQLHAMRRKSGRPIAPANYILADVQIGRIALADQTD